MALLSEASGPLPVFDMLSADLIAEVDPAVPGAVRLLGFAGLYGGASDKVVVALESGRTGLMAAPPPMN